MNRLDGHTLEPSRLSSTASLFSNTLSCHVISLSAAAMGGGCPLCSVSLYSSQPLQLRSETTAAVWTRDISAFASCECDQSHCALSLAHCDCGCRVLTQLAAALIGVHSHCSNCSPPQQCPLTLSTLPTSSLTSPLPPLALTCPLALASLHPLSALMSSSRTTRAASSKRWELKAPAQQILDLDDDEVLDTMVCLWYRDALYEWRCFFRFKRNNVKFK